MLKKLLFVFVVGLLSLGFISPAFTEQTKIINDSLLQDKETSYPIIINAVDRIKYSSPITGFIDQMPFKPGQIFKKSDILVKYNCTVMLAEKEKAIAAEMHLKEKAQNMERLFRLGGASNNDYTESISQAKAAQEELNIKSYIVSQCQIVAPFDGQVVDLMASPYEYIEQGKPLIEVVNLKDTEIKLILPSELLSQLKQGSRFTVTLNETKLNYPATITRLTYSIDPVSNTFTAFGSFIAPQDSIKPGMSGYAHFDKE